MDKKGTLVRAVTGGVSGFLNGLFGSGGGVIAVMQLKKQGLEETRAHATATLIMLVLSSLSLLLYALYDTVPFKEGLSFIPGGLLGAVIGATLLKKIQAPALKKTFGGALIIAGVVMLV